MKVRTSIAAGAAVVLGTTVALLVPAVASAHSDTASAALSSAVVKSVRFSGSAGNYTVTINGSGFGVYRGTLPFTGNIPYLCIVDNAQVGNGTYGCFENTLTVKSWTGSKITVGGFGGSPGDAVEIAIWSPQSTGEVAWGGNIAGNLGTAISSVAVSGSGRNLKFIISGSGFGKAPVKMPYTGDLNFVRLIDWGQLECVDSDSDGLFEAGFSAWGIYTADTVWVRYASWSNTQIVINGFGGEYGAGCAKALAGDPIAIAIYASHDTSDAGPQTAWAGRAA
jgi:hypothetical protein